MTPIDQISTGVPYSFSSNISGAMKAGVPILVFAFDLLELRTRAIPKSANLAVPVLSKKIFAVLRSR